MSLNISLVLTVSTDKVYGALCNEGIFEENNYLKLNNPYSASKASADLIASAYYKTYKFSIKIIRCSINYEPNQLPEKLIPLIINNCKKEKLLIVYVDGMRIIDWLHVNYHIDAINIVLFNGKAGAVYIGFHTVLELYKKNEVAIKNNLYSSNKTVLKYLNS